MTEPRNDYGFPLLALQQPSQKCVEMLVRYMIGDPSIILNPTKLERAQAYAADVRARRGMVVRKGVYLDPTT